MAEQLNFDAKEFCLNLLQSETEEAVIDVLKKYGGGIFGVRARRNDQTSIKKLVRNHGGSHSAGNVLEHAATTLPFKGYEFVITKTEKSRNTSEQYHGELNTSKPSMCWITLQNKNRLRNNRDRIMFDDEDFDRLYLVHAGNKKQAMKIITSPEATRSFCCEICQIRTGGEKVLSLRGAGALSGVRDPW